MSSTATTTPPADVLVCVLGHPSPAWLAAVRDALPSTADVRCLEATQAHAALTDSGLVGATRALVLVRAGALLPPYWFERITAVLQLDRVLAVAPLLPTQLPGVAAPATGAELARLDALCFAHGSRLAGALSHLEAPLLALRNEALALAAQGIDCLDGEALPAPWRLLGMQDLLVADAAPTAPENASVGAVHLDLAARLTAALAADAPDPGYPGLDGKPVRLHVLHGWGGGAARWVGDIARADGASHHLLLEAAGSFRRKRHGERFVLRDARCEGSAWRRFEPAQPIADTAFHHAGYRDFLAAVIADYAITGVVVSSLIGHALDALGSGLPTVLLVHDHYPLWPLLHADFGVADRRYGAAERAQALANAGHDFEFAHRDADYWQRLRDAFVAAARAADATLVAPSGSAMTAQLRLAPELEGLDRHVIAHGLAPWRTPLSLPAPPPRARLRLVVPGRIRAGKGAEVLHALLPDVLEHAELVLLGAGADGMDFFGQAGVHVVLDYAREDLPRLLARLRPDAALLVPTVAETFSYTLSEMRSLGLPVLATAVGALAERIEDGADGLRVAPDAASVVARIAELAADRAPLAAVRERLADQPDLTDLGSMADAYRALWPTEAGLPAVRRGYAGLAEQGARAARERVRRLQQTLAERARALDALEARLEQRTAWAQDLEQAQRRSASALQRLQGEFEERSAWALTMNEELQQLRPEHDMMLRSRSWRLTRPLRGAARLARRLRESVRFRLARMRSLNGRLRGSLGRRGWRGTLQRIGQEFRGRQPTSPTFAVPRPHAAFAPFTVPTGGAPHVSIVMPVYGQFEYTVACLRSLAEHAGTVRFEVIVVDDASPDGSAENLAKIGGIRVHRNAANLGFIGACNAGAALAQGEYVVFLNNDTVVTAGWLEALLNCFAQRADAGLVGARLVYPDGRLQEAGGIVFRDGSGWNYGRFEHPDDPRFGFRREVDYCSGAAIMLRRALFAELGGFDSRYAPAYYEDTDLAFQVRAAGFKVYVEPRAVVVHFEGVSNGTDTADESGIKRYQAVNRDKFLDKWRVELAAHPAPLAHADRAHLAATWRARKRVLIVDASTPEPDQDSGSVRLVNIMRLLRDMGCQVSFLPDNLARFDKYTPLLQAEGIEALYHPFTESLPDFYRQRGREFDLIMVSRHYILAHHLGLIRLHAPQARLAFDTVDLHYLREARAAALDPRPERKRQAEATRGQELKLIRASDVTLVVSTVERGLLATDAPGARVEILSNVHDIRTDVPGFETRRDVLFIGGFQHPPNIDAMLWFVGEVLPQVHAALPELTLHIVGSKMVPEVAALAGDRVRVHGYVEDIEPLLRQARIALAPLRYGAGVKGKVNMAMSRGLPVVATPMAVEGIDAEPGRDVLVGADADAFAEAVVRLYRDAELWTALSGNGIENVRRQFSFDTARKTLEGLLAPGPATR